MPDNLYSPGQKVLSKEGRDNWDAIFGTAKEPQAVLNWTKCSVCGSKHLQGTMCHKCYGPTQRDRFWFAQDIKE